VTLVAESSVSSTARRIEALVGVAAVENFSVEKALVRRLTALLKTPREDLPARVEELVEQVKALEKKVSQAVQGDLQGMVPALVEQLRQGPVGSVVTEVSGVGSADELRALVSAVSRSLGEVPHVVALGTTVDGRGTVVVAASPQAIAQGAHAGDLVQLASSVMGGGGGGKPQLAQGGGPDGSSLSAALAAVSTALEDAR
jgi:alanyl-tRNA synthetase